MSLEDSPEVLDEGEPVEFLLDSTSGVGVVWDLRSMESASWQNNSTSRVNQKVDFDQDLDLEKDFDQS